MTRPPARLGSAFEVLEERALPTTFGVPWADAEHITLSFASDGTKTPLGTSSLARMLGSADSAWKTEILRAFQTWAVNANINIGLVSDGGQALGSTGAVQGDSRFGDIRVASGALSPDSLASASPFSFTGSTLSGDLILNSAVKFSTGTADGYDLFAVALHEAGHSLGLGHAGEDGGPCGCNGCTSFRSVMESAFAKHTGLYAEDIAAIQKLYGARRADAFEGTKGNDTAATASAIPRASGTQLLATADLTTADDVDYYKFTAPALTSMLSAVTVRLKAEGLSLLTAKVTVFDSAGRAVASAASRDPLNNDLQLTFRPGLFGGNYTIKVEGARGDLFDIGAYKVAVDFLSVGGLLQPITTTLSGVADGGTDDVLADALTLQPTRGGDARFDAVYRGVIETAGDVDTYRVGTNKYAAGTPVTLNVMAWGLDAGAVDPRVKVFDASGNPVAFQVLSNSRGLFSVQVLNAVAGSNYFVQVSAREGAAKSTGNYFVAADFNTLTPLQFDGVAGGTATPSTTTTAQTLTLSESGVFQFALGAQSTRAGDAVTMTIADASGAIVATLTAVAGRVPVTATAYLTAGNYTVKYAAPTSNTAATDYALFMMQLSDGVGPYATSTSGKQSSTSSGSTGTTTTEPSGKQSTTTSSSSGSTPTTTSTTTQPATTDEKSYQYSGDSTYKPNSYYYMY